MKFGVISMVWEWPFKPTIIPRVKDMGFDGIEIPVADPKKIDKIGTTEALKSADLKCSSIGGVMSSDRDLIHPSKAVRENAKRYIRACVDIASAFGADIVIGPLYTCGGAGKTKFLPSREAEWKYAVAGLKDVAKYAEDHGVYLGLEPLNRFETHFINLDSDCVKLIKDVGSPMLKVHFDTFHANIEEKLLGDAIRQTGEYLGHVHTCENDRGTPGTGHIPWQEVAQALKDVNYNRWVVIETFTPGIKEIAKACSIWRKLAPTQDEIAAEGLKFLKKLFQA